MKPINLEDQTCSPISSNCVIWQGPDIECLNLCKGETVSTLVAKLATEFCNLLDTFGIDQYDLSCLNLGDCPPEDFQTLIQLLIDRICALEGIDPVAPSESTSGCPDCIVNIAECFYFTNPQGDTETTMQLTDYVTAIGNRFCQIVSANDTVNDTLDNHGKRLTTLEEKADPTLELPQINPVCVLEGAASLDAVLIALEAQFCELITATGQSKDLYTAINKECSNLSNDDQLAGSGVMSSIQGWIAQPQNVASTLTNMWLTMCDVRAAIKNIQATCCPTACDGVDVTLTAELTDPNTLILYFAGTVPQGFLECNPAGSQVTISDTSGGSLVTTVPVIGNLNNALGFQIDLTSVPVNGTEDLTIILNLCVSDQQTQCQSVLQYVITNTVNCPALNLTPGVDNIFYQFNWVGAAASFDVELYDTSGTVLLATQTTAVTGPGTVSGTFTALTAGTLYKVRVVVTAGTTVSNCPTQSTTTLNAPCIPPVGVSAGPITIP